MMTELLWLLDGAMLAGAAMAVFLLLAFTADLRRTGRRW